MNKYKLLPNDALIIVSCKNKFTIPYIKNMGRDRIEIRNEDPNNRTGIRDLILDFRKYLEKEGYAPKSINAWDGAVRGFFTGVLGKSRIKEILHYSTNKSWSRG